MGSMIKRLVGILLVSLFARASGTDCGKWFSSDCLADSDKRYDKGYTNDIKEQQSFWKQYEGYWINEFFQVNNPITGKDFTQPSFFNPKMPYTGIPYKLRRAFYNESIVGSRFYSNRVYIYPPADEIFCNQTIPEGFLNVIGNGQCGVNGYSEDAGVYGTSSYEKDGRIQFLRSTGKYGANANPNSNMTAVDELTFFFASTIEATGFVNVFTGTFLNNLTQISGTQSSFVQGLPNNPILNTQVFLMTKVTREEWLAAIEQEYETANVLPEDRIDVAGIQGCFSGDACLTEEEWCTADPECSSSPYQEPDGTLKAGPIVGIVLAGVVVAVALIVAYFEHKIRQLRKQARHDFARRVAQSVTLTPGSRQLSPEALAAEFKKIDQDKNGTISNEELWEFVSSGKLGEMTRPEFDALYAVMDADGNGTVDFLEFCAYMSLCKADFNEAKDRMSIRQVRASFLAPTEASRSSFAEQTAQRYSSRVSMKVPSNIVEEDDKEEADEQNEDQDIEGKGSARQE
ncbi:hypothetical protein ACA910_014667 [Epithemia clementina (nom. ined.)]